MINNSACDILLDLPYPVSANRYWRSFRHPKTKRTVTVVSAEAKAYKNTVGVLARKAGLTEPIEGRVFVSITLSPPAPKDAVKRGRIDPEHWDDDVRCIDLDNAQKVLLDALRGIAYTDDNRVWRIASERSKPDGQGSVRVRVGVW